MRYTNPRTHSLNVAVVTDWGSLKQWRKSASPPAGFGTAVWPICAPFPLRTGASSVAPVGGGHPPRLAPRARRRRRDETDGRLDLN